MLAFIGQNTSYRLNIGQNENICIGIIGRYVGANISVSAKLLAWKIYIGIGIGWTHIDPTIAAKLHMLGGVAPSS